ncbi:MAG: hypothetical protein NDJ65_03700 [Paludibacteraceae bacterium]|nr:hypothetical protein [Paludibacteraceae bacterium]
MKKLIILALSALMSFGTYAGNVRKSPNRSNNRAQRVSVQRNKAQSNRSWIEAAKSTAGVQFRSSVVNDLNFESINLPYFQDSVAFTIENGAQIAGAQRVKCYQFTVDKDTAIYLAAYNDNERWGTSFKISDEPFQSNYTPDDTLYNSDPVKVNISAGTHYVAFGDNNYYRTDFFASWLSISFEDKPVTAAAPVIRNSLYKEISLPYRNDSLAFTAENGAVKKQTGLSNFSNVLRYRITVPKDTSLYFQGYNSKYDHGISMIIRQSDINSGPYVSIPTTLTSEGATVDLPAGTSYIDLSDKGFSGDEFFVTAFSIRAKGDTLKNVKSPTVIPATPNGAITFKETTLPFNDSIFFNKANGAVYNGYEKLIGFKVTVPQDTAIKYNYSDRYGWDMSLYASNKPFDASLDGIRAYWPGEKINLKAGVNYIAFGDDGFDEGLFYKAKVSIKFTKPDPTTPITFQEISLPYRNDNLAFTAENGAVDGSGQKFLGFKITVPKDTTLNFQGYNRVYGCGPYLYYSQSEFDSQLNGTSSAWLGSSSGKKINLTAGTWYIALGDDGFDNDDYFVTAFAISAENESQSLVSPTLYPAAPITFQEISLPYRNDNLAFTAENGVVDAGYQKLLGFKITVPKDTTLNFQGYNDKYDWGPKIYYSKSEFNNKLIGTSSDWLDDEISLTAGTWYIALSDDGFDYDDYFVTAFAISAHDESLDLVSPTLYPAAPITFKEISLPYRNDVLAFTAENGAVDAGGQKLLGFKITVPKDTILNFQGYNDKYDFGPKIYYSKSEFNNKLNGTNYDWLNEKISLTAGTWYIALSDDRFDEAEYYVTAFAISAEDESQSLVSPVVPDGPLTFQEISLPYSGSIKFSEESGFVESMVVYNLYKFTVADKGLYEFACENRIPLPFVLSQTEFDCNFGGMIKPLFKQYIAELEPGTYYMAIGNDDGEELQLSIKPAEINEVTLPYYHDGTEFTGKVTELGHGIYYDMYTFTLTENKDVYIYGGNVNAGNEFTFAISDSIFTLSDLIQSAPWVNVYPEYSDPVKVSLTAGTYYVMMTDGGFASQHGFNKYVAAVSFSYTDSVAKDKSSLYAPIPYTEITLPYTKTLEFTKENTIVVPDNGEFSGNVMGLKFTVDKDTTIYLQSKDTEHWGVSALIDSCMITVDSIMAAPSHLKNLGYEFMDKKLPVSLKAGTYYIVLLDDEFIEDNPDYSYYSTVFSITFDENPDYLSVEEISKVGVEEGEADAVKAYGRRGSIVVSGAGDAEVKVFGANGAPIYSGNGDAVIPALPGIYAVRVADKAFKVVVR